MTKTKNLINLVLEYQKTKNNDILNKIIELNKNLINWYLENTKLNITKNELYNLIIKGITISSLTYNTKKNSSIIRYIAIGIRNTIDDEINFSVRNRKILFETFLDYKKLIESKYKITLEKDFSIFDDIIDLMCEDKLFRENDKLEVKRRILEILKTYQGNLRLNNSFNLNNLIDLDKIMKSSLSSFEYDILCLSYGLFNNPKLSLDSISKKYNLSISTIKIYKDITLRKLKDYLDYYFNKKEIDINKVKEFLNNILSKEEYLYLTLENGLFNEEIVSQKEISERYNISRTSTSIIINSALTKISFALSNYNKVVPDLKLIKSYLESILSPLELKIFLSSHGLYGYKHLNVKEICQENNIKDIKTIYELNSSIRNKIRKTFYDTFDSLKVKEFLSNILSSFEFKIFTMYYIENKTQKEIANTLNMSRSFINMSIQDSLEKIKVMINLSTFDYDLSKVNIFLKSILTNEEYLVLCYKYGLYNHDKLLLKDIANLLNISNKEVLTISNLLEIKIKRYLNNKEKVLEIK